MSLAAIRSQIKVVLEGVAGMGKVYDYSPYALTKSKWESLFLAGGRLHFWSITRERTAERPFASGQVERAHGMLIRAFYALDEDAASPSEKTFQDLLEAAASALRSSPTLNGAAESSGPPQVRLVDWRLFSDVLCHYAEMALEVREEVSV
ncbi:MAG: hypothetical protein ACE5JJ_10590 [Nitrospinota bacterium]